jgi:hypothetical protein
MAKGRKEAVRVNLAVDFRRRWWFLPVNANNDIYHSF